MKKQIFMSQKNLEESLASGQMSLEGSHLRSETFSGYYQLIPAIKFTACASNPGDPLGYLGKCASLAIFEQQGIEVHMNSIHYNDEVYEVDEGFLGEFFPENETKTDSLSPETADEGVSYDPDLIKILNEDHKALIELFTEIMDCASKDDYVAVTEKLDTFGNRLRLHLMKEQIKFHTYLEQALSHCALTQKMNKTFQDRIKIIGRTALDFIDRYEQCSWQETDKQSFVTGMEELGKILTERIAMEEELFKLYLPKSAYKGAI